MSRIASTFRHRVPPLLIWRMNCPSSSQLPADVLQEPVSAEVFNVLKEENGRLRETVAELERVSSTHPHYTQRIYLVI